MLSPPAASSERLEQLPGEFVTLLGQPEPEVVEFAAVYGTALRAFHEGDFQKVIDIFHLECLGKRDSVARTLVTGNFIFNQDDLALHMGLPYLQYDMIPSEFFFRYQIAFKNFGKEGGLFGYDRERDVIFLPAIGYDPVGRNISNPDDTALRRMMADPRQEFSLPEDTRAFDSRIPAERAVLRFVSEGYLEEYWHWLQRHGNPSQNLLTPLGSAFHAWIAREVGLERLAKILNKEPIERSPLPQDDLSSPEGEVDPRIQKWKENFATLVDEYNERLDSVSDPAFFQPDLNQAYVTKFFAEADFALLMLYAGRPWIDAQKTFYTQLDVNYLLENYKDNNGYELHHLSRTLALKFVMETYGIDYWQLIGRGARGFGDLDP